MASSSQVSVADRINAVAAMSGLPKQVAFTKRRAVDLMRLGSMFCR